jgi:exoribonuclease-2
VICRALTFAPSRSTMRNTTEIDDALSVTSSCLVSARASASTSPPRGWPSNTVRRLTAWPAHALSTVYMPGNKITMLPDAVVQNYTLAGGVDCPAVSLYLTVNESLEVVGEESCLEMVHIAANLRHHEIEPWFNAETIGGPLADHRFKDELLHLWHFANACEGRRGKPSAMQGNNDYNFSIEGDLADPDACTVEISERKRGSPLDKLVAELMIVANSTGAACSPKRTLPACTGRKPRARYG